MTEQRERTESEQELQKLSDTEGDNVSQSNDGGFDANVEIKTKRRREA